MGAVATLEARLRIENERLRQALADVLPLVRAPHDASELARIKAAAQLCGPEKKIDRLRALLAAGDFRAAMALAASFPRLGDDKAIITRAHEAYVRPEWLRQVHRDPDEAIRLGIEALTRRYGKGGE